MTRLNLEDERTTTRRAEDADRVLGLSGLPVWVRAVALVGVPAAIALYLVFSITTFAMGEDGVQGLRSEQRLHSAAMQQHEMDATLRDAEIRRLFTSIMRVQQQICLNTSKTNEDRSRCVP